MWPVRADDPAFVFPRVLLACRRWRRRCHIQVFSPNRSSFRPFDPACIYSQALAQALQCHIQVFSVGLPVLELGEEFKGEPSLREAC